MLMASLCALSKSLPWASKEPNDFFPSTPGLTETSGIPQACLCLCPFFDPPLMRAALGKSS